MVTLDPLTVAFDALRMAMTTVSSSSSRASCAEVTVTDPVREPAGMVMLSPDRV